MKRVVITLDLLAVYLFLILIFAGFAYLDGAPTATFYVFLGMVLGAVGLYLVGETKPLW